ncbi:MAG: hypothetical protein JW940_32255 [Polyangiaceae bacterium]|nr:hypothetical protein [Polyangiaceae bacterium]
MYPVEGAAVLDEDGRIVELKGSSALPPEVLGDWRWPCYAGKIIQYACMTVV